MKRIIFLLISLSSLISEAQSRAGITSEKDTSYTTYSAYTSSKKKYPNIQIAGPYASKKLKEEKNKTYARIGLRELLLDVFAPLKKKKRNGVAIMIIHGGGWRSGNRTQHYALAQRLAALGYVCFTPEYRLSTEALYPAAVYDLKAALRWIHAKSKHYKIDTSKIAVLGFSAGGELATFLAVTNNNPKFESDEGIAGVSSMAHALVNLDGTLSFVHPESGEGDDSKKTSAATYWFGYSKKENEALWKEASPLTYAGPQTPPTLFINSSVDRMHAGRTDYIKVLAKYGIYTEIKSFPDAPHSFPLFHPWFEPTVTYTDDFLKKVFFSN